MDPRPEHGALASFDAPYLAFAVGLAPFPEAKAAVDTAGGPPRPLIRFGKDESENTKQV